MEKMKNRTWIFLIFSFGCIGSSLGIWALLLWCMGLVASSACGILVPWPGIEPAYPTHIGWFGSSVPGATVPDGSCLLTFPQTPELAKPLERAGRCVWGVASHWTIYLYLPWRSQWICWKHGTSNSDVHSWQNALWPHLDGGTWQTGRRIKNTPSGDFPAGPGTKTPRSQCRTPGFHPWSGT